jgi:hypothetical protein
MSKREQIRKLRLRIKQMQGDPISDAIARVMDELSTGHEQPKTYLTPAQRAELDDWDSPLSRELLELLEGKPNVA